MLTNTGWIKAESGHISLCMCVFGDSGEMMAKQSGVHTLTCFSLDTCEDKHRFPWLTLTPCWVNTHLNSHQCSHLRQLLPHSDAYKHLGCVYSRLVNVGRPNKQRQFRVQSSLATALPHIQPLTQQHVPVLWFNSLRSSTQFTVMPHRERNRVTQVTQKISLSLALALTTKAKSCLEYLINSREMYENDFCKSHSQISPFGCPGAKIAPIDPCDKYCALCECPVLYH